MNDDTVTVTVGEIKRLVAEGIRRSLEGLDLFDEGGPDIIVVRDLFDPQRINCMVPVSCWRREAWLYCECSEWDVPVGCRR
jgi:hypothetical protein